MMPHLVMTILAAQREQQIAARARPRVVVRRPPRRAAVFAATAAGGLIVSLDVSVANALIPAIGRDFASTGRAGLSWVITGYAIVFAAALVPAGRLADRMGRRRTYVGGLAVFAAGSLICGFAGDFDVLLLGRAVQGLGAAAASPASLGLLLAAAGPRRRAVEAARWTGAAAVGVCLGPLVGGVLTTLGDWRWAFLVNVPAVAAIALAARSTLSETPRQPGRRLPDPIGAVLVAAAAAALTLSLSESTTWGVLSVRTLTGCGLAAALLRVFVRRSRRVPEPLLQLSLLHNRRVVAVAVVTGCYAAAFFGFLLTFMLFAVGSWQLSLVRAGAAIVVPGAVVVLMTLHVGRLAERLGHRLTLTTGASVMAAALVACATTLGGDHFQGRWLVIGPALGLGIGLCYPVLAGAAVHGLDVADLGAASAINQCARQLGAAVGIASAVAVLGTSPTPDLWHIHATWLLGAAFCLAAGGAAVLIPSTSRRAVAIPLGRREITIPEKESA